MYLHKSGAAKGEKWQPQYGMPSASGIGDGPLTASTQPTQERDLGSRPMTFHLKRVAIAEGTAETKRWFEGLPRGITPQHGADIGLKRQICELVTVELLHARESGL
jgi:hypothetical protein